MNALPHFYSSGTGGVAVINVFNENAERPIFTADSRHPHWAEIVRGVTEGDTNVFDLFDVAGGVIKRFEQVTDRVSFDGDNVLFDGDPIHSVLADQLSRAIADGNSENYVALAKFWEKLESNPSEHSREQAYDWLASHQFKITPEGDVVGYKGVSFAYKAEDGVDVYRSGWASRVVGKPSAFVNGNPIPELSTVPQTIGDSVTMPRSEVVHDPSQACRRGLHVSTRSYAESYGRDGAVLEVHVNPRDIVSVPTDGGGEKVRVCKYKVARVALEHYDDRPVLRDDEDQNVWAGDVGYRV
jgi:hypothetical protein